MNEARAEYRQIKSKIQYPHQLREFHIESVQGIRLSFSLSDSLSDAAYKPGPVQVIKSYKVFMTHVGLWRCRVSERDS